MNTSQNQASTHADVLVIGFGKAGKTIAMNRAEHGDRVILVEQSPKMYGGTCINIGCVPTKTMLVDSEHGVGYEDSVTHRDGFIAQLNSANKQLADSAGVIVIDGHAAFTGSHSVVVTGGDEELSITADTIIINTGSVPVFPDIPGVDSTRVIDSTQAQHLPEKPESLVVVGGGPIGMEFATMFAQFGTKVSILDRGETFGAKFDADVAEAFKADLQAKGITIINSADVESVKDTSDANTDGINVVYSGGKTIDASYALFAIGRRPATDDLGLDAAGINTTKRGAIEVDEHLRTNIDGVYAAGDVNGGPQFTYVSYDDHRVILSDRWGDGKRVTTGRLIPTTTFINPPLSTIGLGEKDARKDAASRGHSVDVRFKKIADIPIMPRPKIVGTPEGVAKFIIDAEDDQILGATLYCVDSQDLINLVAVAMSNKVPASTIGTGIYTHPSSSEVFNALLA